MAGYGTVKMRAVKGVIFDFDGTVADTERFSLEAWPKVSRELGYRVTEEMTRCCVGVNEATERRILCAEFGDAFPYGKIRDEISILHRKSAEKDGIAVKKGFATLIARIKKAALPYALATSTHRKGIGWKLECAGLNGVFQSIVCGDEVENGKPAPDIFLKAARMMNRAPEDCIGIEDSEAGLRGLQSAGIHSVFIKDLITPARDVMAGVWRECRDLGEVCAFLDGGL
ncbi:MAG: HAD family phosphatase [Spirochaetaceae bacterium]|jgi:HAD superfamily hydrolase (TIGR01509 family)|nr:HAD family phosphatase [Spirochaetaceae bacterium]